MDNGYYLKNEDKLYINKSYGGKQIWIHDYNISSHFYSNRSCSVVLVANMIYYLSQADIKYKTLYSYTYSLDGYLKLLEDLFKIIKPKPWGIRNLKVLSKKVDIFLENNNVDVEVESLRVKNNKKEAVEFIKDSIKCDRPVGMITWNSKINNLYNHWVMITGIYKKDDDYFIVTSNWGYKKVYNLSFWLNDRSFYKGLIKIN